jgi:hypothetical protein
MALVQEQKRALGRVSSCLPYWNTTGLPIPHEPQVVEHKHVTCRYTYLPRHGNGALAQIPAICPFPTKCQ